MRYFWEGFQPSVQVKIEQRDWEFNSFKEIIKKAVDAKAKAILRPCFYACNTNQYYLQGSRPSVAKTNTQDQLMKDLWFEKPKPKF